MSAPFEAQPFVAASSHSHHFTASRNKNQQRLSVAICRSVKCGIRWARPLQKKFPTVPIDGLYFRQSAATPTCLSVLLLPTPQSQCLSRHPRPHILNLRPVLPRKIECGGNIALAPIHHIFRVTRSARRQLPQLLRSLM